MSWLFQTQLWPKHPNSCSFAMSVTNTAVHPCTLAQNLGVFLVPLLAPDLISYHSSLGSFAFDHTSLFAKFVPIRRPLHLLRHLHGNIYPQISACSLLSETSSEHPIQTATRPSLSTPSQLYVLHSIITTCLSVYCLCLYVSSTRLEAPQWQAFFFSTSEPLALRTVPGTQ